MQNNINRDLAKYRLERSADDLDASRLLLASNKFNASVNRAYYCIFHAMRAVLALDRKDYSKHSAVISFFTKDYILTGHIDKKFGKTIRLAEMLRSGSDYADYRDADNTEAIEIINNASKFFDTVNEYIASRIILDTDQ